jgi:hypothetical protein
MKFNMLLTILLFLSFVGYSQTKKELHEQVQTLLSEKQKLLDEKQKMMEDYFNLKQRMIDLETENLICKKEKERLGGTSTLNNDSPSNNTNPAVSNQNLESTGTSGGRCQAITAKGTQCSRKADPGSNYCWQHKSTYEPESSASSNSNKSTVSSTKSQGTSTSGGRTIMTGPRGGKYYINSKGNKTYIKK